MSEEIKASDAVLPTMMLGIGWTLSPILFIRDAFDDGHWECHTALLEIT